MGSDLAPWLTRYAPASRALSSLISLGLSPGALLGGRGSGLERALGMGSGSGEKLITTGCY